MTGTDRAPPTGRPARLRPIPQAAAAALAAALALAPGGCDDGRRDSGARVRGSLSDFAAAAGYGVVGATLVREGKDEAVARKVVLRREDGSANGLSIAEARVLRARDGRERFVLRGVLPFPAVPAASAVDIVAETGIGTTLASLLVTSSPAEPGTAFRLSARVHDWSGGVPTSMDLDMAGRGAGPASPAAADARASAHAAYDPATRRLTLAGLGAQALSGERALGDAVLEDVTAGDLAGLARAALLGPAALGAAAAGLRASRLELLVERTRPAPTAGPAAAAAGEARDALLGWLVRGQATRARAESANALVAYFSGRSSLRARLLPGRPVPLSEAADARSGQRLRLESIAARTAAESSTP